MGCCLDPVFTGPTGFLKIRPKHFYRAHKIWKLSKNSLAKPLVESSSSLPELQQRTTLAQYPSYSSASASASIFPFPITRPKVTDLTKFSSTSVMATSSGFKESPSNNPGLNTTPDKATKGYIMQQTMFRIKDPNASLKFYSEVLGMSLLKRLDFPEMKFSLYFLGYEDLSSAPDDPIERTAWTFGQKATIELTHNWGTESDRNFKGYHNGNSEPRGFGHIGITVDDTYKACQRFESLGVEFVKKPDDGKMKGIAFIKDPDGYWIEIFDTKTIGQVAGDAA